MTDEFTFDTDFDMGSDFTFDPFDSEEKEEQDFGNVEEQAKQELSETLLKFKQRAQEEESTRLQNIGTDYWFAVYFANQNDRDRFLQMFDLFQKLNSQYIDGQSFIDALGVKMELSKITPPKPFRKPKGIEDLILE